MAGARAGVVWPVHQCKLVGELDSTYKLGDAASSSIAKPCTNRPVQCENCEQVVASYSMEQHYMLKHYPFGATMSDKLAETIALGKHEREHVLQLLTKRKVENVCKGASCCPKVGSKKRKQGDA